MEFLKALFLYNLFSSEHHQGVKVFKVSRCHCGKTWLDVPWLGWRPPNLWPHWSWIDSGFDTFALRRRSEELDATLDHIRLNPAKTELLWLHLTVSIDACFWSVYWAIAKSSKYWRIYWLGRRICYWLHTPTTWWVFVTFTFDNWGSSINHSHEIQLTPWSIHPSLVSCLDYCNGVLAGQSAYAYQWLQSVLWSATRLVLKLLIHESVIDQIHYKLHWLRFPQRSLSSYALSKSEIFRNQLTKTLESFGFSSSVLFDHSDGVVLKPNHIHITCSAGIRLKTAFSNFSWESVVSSGVEFY